MMKKLFAAFLLNLWAGLACAGVPCSLPFNLQNNTTADATQVMANYNALVTCLGNAAAAGANSDITGLFGLTSPLGPTFGGANTFYGGTSVGTNSVTITVVPNTFTLTTGFMVSFTVGGTNTGASTLTVNGGATTNIFRATPSGPQALTGGELISGDRVLLGYDGTQWQLLATGAQFGGYGPLTTIASAATTDLGTVASHNIQITGSTTITAFGSSANTAYPVYKLEFTGTPVLTNSASLALISGANITAAAGDTAEMLYSGAGIWFMLSYSRGSGQPLIPSTIPATTVQIFTSGSGTYTPTAGTKRIHVRMAGGGGGGGGGLGAAGGNGGASSFGTWTANAGAGGQAPPANTSSTTQGGAGGSGGTNGTGTLVFRMPGGSGGGGGINSVGGNFGGGQGGANFFGGAGGGGGFASNGQAGATNTGAGGGGASCAGSNLSASGGGAGEAVEFWVQSPAAVSYAVGGAGAAGGVGTSCGGIVGAAGAAGVVVIEEFYY